METKRPAGMLREPLMHLIFSNEVIELGPVKFGQLVRGVGKTGQSHTLLISTNARPMKLSFCQAEPTVVSICPDRAERDGHERDHQHQAPQAKLHGRTP